MSSHSFKKWFFCAAGLTVMSTGSFLESTTIVSSSVDNGTEQPGTLSYAITEINADLSTGPIKIRPNSLEIEGIMPPITQDLRISFEVGNGTVYGNDYLVIDVTSGATVSFLSDVSLTHSQMRASNHSFISLQGYASEWNDHNIITLNSGGLDLFLTGASGASGMEPAIFTGDIVLADNTENSINSRDHLEMSGNITGNNSLLTFNGSIALIGSNTWTGGLVVAGTLDVYSSSALPSNGDITIEEGNLVFFLSPGTSYTGIMDITGDRRAWIDIFDGDITLTGDITGLGNINLDGGNLTLRGNCSVPDFDFGSKASVITVTGNLNGENGLRTESGPVATPGTLSLFNEHEYTGDTSVGSYTKLLVNTGAQIGHSFDDVTVNFEGVLTNNGTIYASSVIINNGAILEGSGTIYGDIVSLGDVNPGNSPGTLTVSGNVESLSGSTMGFAITPTQASMLDVTGEVILDSDVTLVLNPEPACYPQQTNFTIINDGEGFVGTFSQVKVGSIFLTANLTYSPTGLTVSIDREPITNLGLRGNAKAVGQALNTLLDASDSGACQTLMTLFLLNKSDVSAALNQMQPAFFKGMTISQENNAVKVRDALSLRVQRELDRVHCYKIDKGQAPQKEQKCQNEVDPFHVWVNGMGDSLSQHSNTYADSPQVGYHDNMAGVVAGADYHFAKVFYVGALGAYTDSKTKWVQNQGSGTIKSGYGGLYLSALGEMFYGNASVIGSWNSFHEHRNILLPATDFTAHNEHGGSQILSHVDTGVNLGWGGFTIRPFDSFDYIAQKENSFKENGAGKLDLSVRKSNAILLRNELGLNFSGCFCIAKSQWTVSPKISWVREVRVKGSHYTAEFVGTGVPFTVTGYFPSRSLVSPGVSVTGSMLDDLLTVGLYYNGEFKGGYSDHSYGGEVRFGF